jgi:hypothetical protein
MHSFCFKQIATQANLLMSVQDGESLPHVLGELSFEQFQRSDKPIITPSRRSSSVIFPREHKSDGLKNEIHHCGGSGSVDISTSPAKRQAVDDRNGKIKVHKLPMRYITPARQKKEDYSNEESNHHRGISDDFDLFDGELLTATKDDVLATAAKKMAES